MYLSAWDSYAPTLLRWLLVGGGMIAIVVGLNKGLQALGVKRETARGFALVSPWLLGYYLERFSFAYSFYLSTNTTSSSRADRHPNYVKCSPGTDFGLRSV
jgi:hypothetical protein